MIRVILAAGIALLFSLTTAVRGQTAFTGSYLEDFDSLGPTGTSLMPGWAGMRFAGSGTLGAPLALTPSTGSSTSGGLFNVGSSGDPDRALGSLSSSTTVPRFGASFLNSTSDRYAALTLSAVMEQWRTGASDAVNELLTFEYSFDASDINDPTASWTSLATLDLPERLTASTSGGAVDGNLPENQLALSGVINGVNWAPNEVFTIRWTDTDDTGSDGMYAVDNFRLEGSVAPVPEPSVLSLAVLGAAGMIGLGRRWRRSQV